MPTAHVLIHHVSIQKQSCFDVTLLARLLRCSRSGSDSRFPRSKTAIGSVTSSRSPSQDVGARAADYFDIVPAIG
jgi:hypothetical protein